MIMCVSDSSATPSILSRLHQQVTLLASDVYGSRIQYEALPPAMVVHGFEAGLRQNIDLVFHSLTTGAPPSEMELQPIVELALERIRDGADLAEILSAYHEMTRIIWEGVLTSLDDADLRDACRFVPAITRHIAEVTSRITVAASAFGETASTRVEARRAYTAALMTGVAPADLATAARITPATHHLVLDLTLAPDASARSVRLLERTLSVHGGLFVPNDRGWIVIVPNDDDSQGELTAALQKVSSDGAFFHAGCAEANSLADVPAAVDDARALRTVCALGSYTGTPATRESEPFSLLVLQSSVNRSRLAAMAAIVHEYPDLEATLRAFVVADGNQAATARILHVHRNTVPYRLARIAELTGSDPLTVDGAAMLRASLLVYDIDGAGSKRSPGRIS